MSEGPFNKNATEQHAKVATKCVSVNGRVRVNEGEPPFSLSLNSNSKLYSPRTTEAPSDAKATVAKGKDDAKPVDVSAVKIKTFAELMAK